MSDAIVVLNAGSSSIKFALFVERRGDLELDVGGQIEGLYTAPRFVARDRSGEGSKRKHPGRTARTSVTALRSTTPLRFSGNGSKTTTWSGLATACTAAWSTRSPSASSPRP
jgi:hypothetical protein